MSCSISCSRKGACGPCPPCQPNCGSGELSTLYKNSFMKLDATERSGKDCTKSRIQLICNFKTDLTEQIDMLCDMLETTIQEKDDLAAQLCERTDQLECTRQNLEEARREICCLKDNVKCLEDKVADLNCEMERLSCEATKELEEQDEELCRVRRNMDSLQCELSRRTQEIDELQCELRDTQNQLRCTQSDLCSQQETNRQLECKFENYIRSHRHSNEEFTCKEEDLRAMGAALRESERENCMIKQKLVDLSQGRCQAC